VPAENVLEIVLFEKYIDAPVPAHIHTQKKQNFLRSAFQKIFFHFSTHSKIHFRVQKNTNEKKEDFLAYPKHPQPRGERPKPPLSIWWLSSWSGVDGSDHNMSYTI